jgi:hypothetical protein
MSPAWWHQVKSLDASVTLARSLSRAKSRGAPVETTEMVMDNGGLHELVDAPSPSLSPLAGERTMSAQPNWKSVLWGVPVMPVMLMKVSFTLMVALSSFTIRNTSPARFPAVTMTS